MGGALFDEKQKGSEMSEGSLGRGRTMIALSGGREKQKSKEKTHMVFLYRCFHKLNEKLD